MWNGMPSQTYFLKIVLWRKSLGNLEKNLRTADQTGDKLNLNMMPVQEWNSSHRGVGVGLFLPLLHLCLGQRVERNPKCSLKYTFLLKSIMLRIPNLCSIKRKKSNIVLLAMKSNCNVLLYLQYYPVFCSS